MAATTQEPVPVSLKRVLSTAQEKLAAHILEQSTQHHATCIGLLQFYDVANPTSVDGFYTVFVAQVAKYKSILLKGDLIYRDEIHSETSAQQRQWVIGTLGMGHVYPTPDLSVIETMEAYTDPIETKEPLVDAALVDRMLNCASLHDDLQDLVAVYMVVPADGYDIQVVRCLFCPDKDVRFALEASDDGEIFIDDDTLIGIAAMNASYPPYEESLIAWQQKKPKKVVE